MKHFYFFLIGIAIVTTCSADLIQLTNESSLPNDPARLYIDIVKRIVSNTIYEDAGYIGEIKTEYDNNRREIGQDWPTIAHTMIGSKRLDNIQFCLEDILNNNVPGDCIETGVWRGGATILMRAILKAYGVTDRLVWVADSFEGLPPPNPKKYPQDSGVFLNKFTILSVSLEQVQNNFQKYGLLDKQVVFLKGFFRDTLPDAPIVQISLLRLDGDLYESTIEALEYLYPKLSIGGYLIIDDYGSNPTCAEALHDYRKKYNIDNEMIRVDEDAVFWKKTKNF